MSKLAWLGIALVLSGVASGILEHEFYGGRLDENDVLQGGIQREGEDLRPQKGFRCPDLRGKA